jgi:cation diffusion facilitator CzcD-associated flavoprotein CzcO
MARPDLTGKRVGVIGNGSTGNQVITVTAPIARYLTSSSAPRSTACRQRTELT